MLPRRLVSTPRNLGGALAVLLVAACGGGDRAADAGLDAAPGPADVAPRETASVEPDAAAPGDAAPQPDVASPDGGTAPRLWSLGYYASWDATRYPVAAIEWSGMTHIAVAFYGPAADGSLSLAGGNPEVARQLVAAAHAHGVRALASLGGSDSAPAMRRATASGVIDTFVSNLLALADAFGYDGFDVDWEPLEIADQPVVVDLANRLRARRPGLVLTIPIGALNVNQPNDLSHYAAIAAAYDQLNIMSYGVSGAWPGWKSWHSSPIYQTDSATPIAIDSTVRLYVAAGVPRARLGVGIGFFGQCYSSPVTAPEQPLGGATILAGDGALSYANILSRYVAPGARHWDAMARVPYLSFGAPHAPDGCSYISYDDEQSIQEKAAYVRAQGLGGVIEWEINEGYVASAPAGATNPLLVAIHDALLR